jgi:hypothetical protein
MLTLLFGVFVVTVELEEQESDASTMPPFKVANDLLKSPTFQAVVLGDSLYGSGTHPAFTPRQMVAGEHAKSPCVTGNLTNAESGKNSKFCK